MVGETVGLELIVIDEEVTVAVRLVGGVEREDQRFEASFAS